MIPGPSGYFPLYAPSPSTLFRAPEGVQGAKGGGTPMVHPKGCPKG